jgi:dTDP-glucose 4,6-dehydratase
MRSTARSGSAHGTRTHAPAELTNKELTARLLEALDKDWRQVEYVADRKGHDRRYSLGGTRLRGLGYRPRIDFEQGLKDTVRWYADNADWWMELSAPPFREKVP